MLLALLSFIEILMYIEGCMGYVFSNRRTCVSGCAETTGAAFRFGLLSAILYPYATVQIYEVIYAATAKQWVRSEGRVSAMGMACAGLSK